FFAAAPADSPSQMDRQILRSPPCQAGPERVAKALFRDRPSRHRTHPGPLKPKCTSENAPVAQLDRAPDYESGGQEFESLRARHFIKHFNARIAPFPYRYQ